MKVRVLKSVLPMLAIVLAVGLAFATEANSSSQIGYYDDPLIPGIQQVQTDCEPTGTEENCFHNGYQLFDEPELITPLKRVVE